MPKLFCLKPRSIPAGMLTKKAALVLICSIVALSGLIPVNFCYSTPRIGIFYYTWYNPDWSFSWDPAKIVDKPVLGYYSSCDQAVVERHLKWIEDLGADFLLISWWGFYSDYGKFTCNATEQIFETAQNARSNLKFAIMVEPFDSANGSYYYDEIYDYIFDNFVSQYSFYYYRDGGKPLVCFFNNRSLTDEGTIPLDARFNVVFVGQQLYANWIYTDLNRLDFRGDLGEKQTSVTPRFDESHLPDRPGNVTVDVYLNESTYDLEWTRAIRQWREGKIDTILISTWNEYPERTEIEPHIDATAANQDPYFLYNKTKNYIAQCTRPEQPSPMGFAAVALVVVMIGLLIQSRIRVKKDFRNQK